MRKRRKNAVILAVLGHRRVGRRSIKEMIDYRISRAEDVQSYRELLKSLKQRGLNFNIAVHDGEQAISGALKSVYNNPSEQLCLFHKMKNVLELVKSQWHKEILKEEIWRVYDARTKIG